MHSSTSSSDAAAGSRRHHGRLIAATLAGAVLFWLGLEAVSYFGLRHISQIERRRIADEAAALALRPVSKEGAPTFLLMGNSLLLEGLDYQQIRKLTRPRAEVVRFAVENTSYHEWYFGIRTLLARGSRPHFMILCLSPSQLIGAGLASEYAGQHFFQARDLYAASRVAHYDLTGFSGLLFAQCSFFYARRNTLRTVVLSGIAPAYWALARKVTSQSTRFPSSQEIERISAARLSAVRETDESAGVRFAFLIPPGFSQGEPEIVAAGARAGTRVVIPIHTGVLPANYFADGFHLNPKGARVFTAALASELSAMTNRENRAVPGAGVDRGELQ